MKPKKPIGFLGALLKANHSIGFYWGMPYGMSLQLFINDALSFGAILFLTFIPLALLGGWRPFTKRDKG